MRHNKKFNHLGRTAEHRKAMLANMATSLILHKRIETTKAKAKALRVYIEPLITKSKNDTTHSRRTVFSYLKNKVAVTELFREVAPKIADRPGGYTRILKTGFRAGDAADMAMIELVDFNKTALTSSDKAATKKTTRRGRTKKTTDVSITKVTERAVDNAAVEVVENTTAKIVDNATTENEIEENIQPEEEKEE
jgi:large subunit ribosomal protein L17